MLAAVLWDAAFYRIGAFARVEKILTHTRTISHFAFGEPAPPLIMLLKTARGGQTVRGRDGGPSTPLLHSYFAFDLPSASPKIFGFGILRTSPSARAKRAACPQIIGFLWLPPPKANPKPTLSLVW